MKDGYSNLKYGMKVVVSKLGFNSTFLHQCFARTSTAQNDFLPLIAYGTPD